MTLPGVSWSQAEGHVSFSYSGQVKLPSQALSANLEVRLKRQNDAGDWVTVWCERHPDTPLNRGRFQINIGKPAWPDPEQRRCVLNDGEIQVLGDNLVQILANGPIHVELRVGDHVAANQGMGTAPYALISETAHGFGPVRIQKVSRWCGGGFDSWCEIECPEGMMIISGDCQPDSREHFNGQIVLGWAFFEELVPPNRFRCSFFDDPNDYGGTNVAVCLELPRVGDL